MTTNINNRASHIEETGIFFEQLGLTRMAGRIFGYLSVTDKEHVSFDELVQVLQASKSSISTNVKSLMQVGFIKPITHSGERRTYYCLTPNMDWGKYAIKRMKETDYFRKLVEDAYDLRVNKNDNTSKWLANSGEFFTWLTNNLTDLVKEWNENKNNL